MQFQTQVIIMLHLEFKGRLEILLEILWPMRPKPSVGPLLLSYYTKFGRVRDIVNDIMAHEILPSVGSTTCRTSKSSHN